MMHEVMSVLVQVTTVQTCGDWSVFCHQTNSGLRINCFSNTKRKYLECLKKKLEP